MGSIAGGYFRTLLGGARGARRGAGAALAAATPLVLLALWAPSAVAAFAILLVVSALNSCWYGPVFSEVQELAEPRTRAMAAAVFNLIVNLLGLGLGPSLVGALSDLAGRGGASPADALRIGLAASVVFNLLAAALLVSIRRASSDDFTKSEDQSHE